MVQVSTAGREMQQPLAPVGFALKLVDETLIDKIFENPAEALLGNTQNIQELGNCHAGITSHKVNHTVMGAAKI